MTITICGSQTFCKEMEQAQKELTSRGITTFAPEVLETEEWFQEKHSREELLRMKPIWTQNHFKRIAESDAVLIMNLEKKGIPGYFGSNTLMEFSVAFFLRKKIYLYNPVTEDHPHYEEVIGVDLEVINGVLGKING